MQWLIIFDNGTTRSHAYVHAPDRASAIDKARPWIREPAGHVLAATALRGAPSDPASAAALVTRHRSPLAGIHSKGKAT